MAKRPLQFGPRGGHEALAEQRPMDGTFSVGPGSIEPPPLRPVRPVNLQQLPLTASNGAPSVLTQKQPKYGFASVGLGPSGQQTPCSSQYPGVHFHHPVGYAFAGHLVPSTDEVLARCLKVINRGSEQCQNGLPATTALPSNAMAAAPSSASVYTAEFEVMSTVRLVQRPSRSTESRNVQRVPPLNVRNRTGCGQGVRQEGGRTSRSVYKGRKRNNSAIPKRRTRKVEPLEAQVWLESTVEMGTSIVIGKQFGSPAPPAAVCATAAPGPTQRLASESFRDVIHSSAMHRKIIHSTEGPVLRSGSDGVDDNGRCHTNGSSMSAKKQKSTSTNINNQRPASCVIDAVDQLDRCKQTPAVIPVEQRVCAPPAVVTHLLIGVIKKIECRRASFNLILHQHRCSFPQAESVNIKAHQLFIIHQGRWLYSGGVVSFADRPPPWPPPAQDRPARNVVFVHDLNRIFQH